MNNILAGLSGNVYLAKAVQKDKHALMQKLDSAESLVERASDLIRQLLTIARKDQVKMQQLSLTSVIEKALHLLSSSIPENVSIRNKITTEPLMIHGNETHLHQVVMNLLINARDALQDSSHPEIIVTVERFEADPSWLQKHPHFEHEIYAHLSVVDNGPGIPKANLEHLFEPFFTTKEQGKGTGLGLAMVFAAIKSHGGMVEVESSLGEGTRFDIYIPLFDDDNQKKPSLEGKKVALGKNELILVVDDDSQVIDVSKELVESFGYRVIVASDGIDAVARCEARQDEISLVITDVVMPKLGGVDAYQRMKAIKPDVKVIFLSGYDQGKVELTGHTVLAKPCNVYELSDAIRKELDACDSKHPL